MTEEDMAEAARLKAERDKPGKRIELTPSQRDMMVKMNRKQRRNWMRLHKKLDPSPFKSYGTRG